MTLTRATLAGIACAAMASGSHAATITLEGITTPIAYNAQVTAAPTEIASGIGQTIATGLNWSGGEGFDVGLADQFLAWCFDLIHPVSLGGTYEYVVTDSPFASSYLLDDAGARVSALLNANYDDLDISDTTQAAAFQLAVWEVANDDDFDLSAGVFQAAGIGGNASAITATAQAFLADGSVFDGPLTWQPIFLETREAVGTQNLVTAVRYSNSLNSSVSPVPIPAAGLLLVGGLGALAAVRRRRSKTAA